MQIWMALGVPGVTVVTVLIGILINLIGVGRLENRLLVIEGDLRRFYQILGEHSAKIDNHDKRIDNLDNRLDKLT